MKKRILSIFTLMLLLLMVGNIGLAQEDSVKKSGETKELVVLWTTAEKDVFTKMVGLYVYNAKKNGWFENITFVIWGPSSKLLAEDKEVQEWLEKFKKEGIKLEACIWCTNQYGVTETLKDMGVDVRGMGVSLTEYIKDSGKELITF